MKKIKVISATVVRTVFRKLSKIGYASSSDKLRNIINMMIDHIYRPLMDEIEPDVIHNLHVETTTEEKKKIEELESFSNDFDLFD